MRCIFMNNSAGELFLRLFPFVLHKFSECCPDDIGTTCKPPDPHPQHVTKFVQNWPLEFIQEDAFVVGGRKRKLEKVSSCKSPTHVSCFSLFEFPALELSQWSVRRWKNFAWRHLKKWVPFHNYRGRLPRSLGKLKARIEGPFAQLSCDIFIKFPPLFSSQQDMSL